MSELITAVPASITSFAATNIDDIVILTLLFSQVNATFQRRHIVTGQYLGFAALVLVSLPGFLGGLIMPQPWIGLLGLVPIAIGLGQLFNREEDEEADLPPTRSDRAFAGLLSPQSYGVAAVTFANGGDNIGIYMPLFASSELPNLMVTLGVFFSLVGVWCYTAYCLTRQPAIATRLTRYGSPCVPFVLIAIGAFILWDSGTLENQLLTVIAIATVYLCLVMLGRFQPPSEVEN